MQKNVRIGALQNSFSEHLQKVPRKKVYESQREKCIAF